MSKDKKEEKQLVIHYDNNKIKSLREHIFFFKKAKEILCVAPETLKTFSLPSEKSLFVWVYDNFECLQYENDFGFLEKVNFDVFKNWFGSEYVKLIEENQFEIFEYVRDPFAKFPKILKKDNKLRYIAPGIFLNNFSLNFLIEDEFKKEIIEDYLEHFENLNDILQWIVACRFNEARRNSFLYLRVNAGFGKSFFLSILEELEFATSVRHSQLREQSASDISPSLFRNSFVLAIDEFTHFGQELKYMTHSMNLSAKYQLSESVPLYAKIFLSAEKSTSFFGDAGVDSQIAERVSVVDLAHVNKLDERLKYTKNKKLYKEVIKEYVHDFIKNEIERYLVLGELKANEEADVIMQNFHRKFKPEANTIQRIQERIFGDVEEFVEWSLKGEKVKNSYFEQIEKVVAVKNEKEIVIKNITKFYELLIREQGEQFAKIAKFKQTALDEIFCLKSLERKPIWVKNATVRGILVHLDNLKKSVKIEIFDKNGFKNNELRLENDVLINANGKELF